MGFMSMAYGLGTVLGPIIGGVLATSVTWR
jgi:MFS family permease